MAKNTIKMATFINKFRRQITSRIIELHEDLKSLVSMKDAERKVMILNEPTLANWATSEGVIVASELNL